MKANLDRSEFTFPTSEIAVTADRFVADISPAFLYNHCVRAYLFGRKLAAATGLRPDRDFDDELVYLSCILHDLGATEHANGNQRFEVDGADAALKFLRDHDVDERRARTVWNAIALHSSEGIAARLGPVEAITHMGTGADILGLGRELLTDQFAERVHDRWPRHNIGYALAQTVAEQVHRNPAKGSPLSLPGHWHQLFYRADPVSWFDLIEAAGWDDQPDADAAERNGPQSPDQLAEQFMAAFTARDLDTLRSLYEPAALYAPSPTGTITGKDAIADSLDSMMKSGAAIDLKLRRIRVAGDLALISNDATVVGSPDGEPLVTTTTEIARRQSDGRWLYVLDDPFFSH
ncbi:DUF4440 domain-containing protein [Mycobacterium deserti]|uniref:Nuclear transport factor 2 family protein n=1 Tax=Mycobacterium deserti TaxID=2978347 RepID=A0ABT2MHU8_9MYCO|nr:DUF4440 domain-containing protein [Mycobacterium deserti]MCT7661850.1 nuclear transport factor 2 family protein [Mycobacterium deserti]